MRGGRRPSPGAATTGSSGLRALLVLAALLATPAAASPGGLTPQELARHVGLGGERVEVAGAALHDAASVRRFYRERGYRPAWTGEGCQLAMAQLMDAIRAADSHGLEPTHYHLAALEGDGHCREDQELLATDAWLALATHLHAGRLDPLTVEPDWTAVRPDLDAVATLEAALGRGEVAATLERLAPPDRFYATMRGALAHYRTLAAAGGWPGIEPGPTLRPGDEGPRVAQLRARLWHGGLLEAMPDEPASAFDAELEEAVRRFQRRANLEPDGLVGALTLAQLNVTATQRVAQLRANLERWRWLPEDLGERHLRVNIADFSLEARDDGRVEREHKVIVGKLYRRTPSFSADMTHLVLNPWWEVPRRLAVQDKLPQFQRDPGAVERLGFEVVGVDGRRVDPATIDWRALSRDHFPYRLRQRPGPANALGQVKLMLPNGHDVYLHDTPTRDLFERTRRDFSSGCIRVEDALGLAAWLLADTPGWDRARIDEALAPGSELRVSLATRVPVHLVYLTVVDDGMGGVRFVDDLYDRDGAVVAALDADPRPR